MKKLKVIIPVLLVVAMLFTLCSCGKKESIMADAFIAKAEELGYSAQHCFDSDKDYGFSVSDIAVAYDKTLSLDTSLSGVTDVLKVVFYQLSNEDDAAWVYAFYAGDVSESCSTKVSSSLTHSESFKGDDGTTYYRIVRINDTVICASVDISCKEAVDTFF